MTTTDSSQGSDDDAGDPVSELLSVAFGVSGEDEPAADEVSAIVQRVAGEVFLGRLAAGPADSATPDRYRVDGELSRGGMGIVLRARDTSLRRDIAFKTLRQKHLGKPEMVRRFVEEAQIAAQLEHPGIVSVHDVGRGADGAPYFVMRLVDGRTLAALLAERTGLVEARVRFLRIFEQICQAMAYAHDRGVVHRDLKPSNVMIGPFGEMQVMDWGLAKVLRPESGDDPAGSEVGPAADVAVDTVGSDTDVGQSRSGTVIGTVPYMAPEQARGESSDHDRRSDVFSLGAILLEILTGAPPFRADSAASSLEMAAAARLEPALAALERCDADQEIVDLARRCLAPRPDDRPRDAIALGDAVSRYLISVEERVNEARIDAAEARARATEERRSRRKIVPLAALVVLAVLIGTAFFVQGQREHRTRVENATRAVARALADARAEHGRIPAQTGADWSGALAAAREAVAVAQSPDAPATLRREAIALLARVESEQVEAERADRMLVILDDIRPHLGDQRDPRHIDDEFRDAFAQYGLDPDSMSVAAAAERVEASRIAAILCSALDEWTAARRRLDDGGDGAWTTLAEIAIAADSDSLRRQLRGALRERDLERLREVADSPELRRQPGTTVDLLAKSLFELGDKKRALAVYRDGHLRYPGDFWISHNLASLLVGMRAPPWNEIVRLYASAVAVRPDGLHVACDLADAVLQQDETRAAKAIVEDVIRRRAEDARAWHILGNVRIREGDLEGAVAAFDRSVAFDPKFANGHCNRGAILFRLGRPAEAKESFETAVKLNPKLYEGHLGLGVALRQLGEGDRAIAALERAVELRPDSVEPLRQLGETLVLLGQSEAAEEVLERAVDIDAEDGRIWHELGLARVASGAIEDGEEALRRAVALAPDLAEAHCDLGMLLASEGRLTLALECFRRGHELGTRRGADWHHPSARWIEEIERLIDLGAEARDRER